MQARVQTCRDWNRLRVAKNFNTFFGLIEDHRAVFAVFQMPFELLFNRGLELAVDVVRQFANDAFAIQFRPP